MHSSHTPFVHFLLIEAISPSVMDSLITRCRLSHLTFFSASIESNAEFGIFTINVMLRRGGVIEREREGGRGEEREQLALISEHYHVT